MSCSGRLARTRRWRSDPKVKPCASGRAGGSIPPTAAAAPAALPGPRRVDGQGPTVHLLAVEGGDGGLGLRVAAHFDEAEPLGTAGVPVHEDLRRLHRAVRLKLSDEKTKITHVRPVS